MNNSKFLNKKKEKNIITSNSKSFVSILNKIMFCTIIFLLVMIFTKNNPDFKSKIYNKIFSTNISFSSINKWCKERFNSILPDDINSSSTVAVFSEKLEYSNISNYENGAKLEVSNNYLIPVIESGTVVYLGDKNSLGNTIIIQQINGIDIWYSNIKNCNVKLYDYVEKGSYLCDVNGNYLYLNFQKNGEFLDYKEYL